MKTDNLTGTSRWQLVFSQSKANGAYYNGEELPTLPWHWPKDTFLQRRRKLLKSSQGQHERNLVEPSERGFYESICSEYVRSGSGDGSYYKNSDS
jgi:hypothetical protein